MRHFLLAALVLSSAPGRAPAEDPARLPDKEWQADRARLVGEWHTGPDAPVPIHFAFTHRGSAEPPNGLTLVIGGDLARAYRATLDDEAHHYPKRGVRYLIDHSPVHRMISYRFDKETLLLKVEAGPGKGEHRLRRMARIEGTAVRPLGGAAALADLERLAGRWATQGKKALAWEVTFKVERVGGKAVGGAASFSLSPKPAWRFGGSLTAAAFWCTASGKRRFLSLGEMQEVPLLEYRIDGDELILVVADGEAEGVHTLRRVKE